jgi:membrane-bound lytic murein transglycosylase F
MEELSPAERRPARYLGDLPDIRERGVLRVLTRNNPTSYFVWRGHILGFEHDLVVALGKALGVHVEFVVAPNRASLYAWLLDGYGDLVAAGITLPDTASRMMAYSRSYNRVVETVVTDSADHALGTVEDLAGRSIALRVSSAYWETAERLRESGIDVNIVPVTEEMETAEILERVATGEYDVTIADSHILDMELTWRDDIRGAFTVSDTVDHAWIVRPGDRELLATVNRFLDSIVRGEFYNVTKRKYFGNSRSSRQYVLGRSARTGALSPYDELTRRYSSRYDFNWIMVTAQMYEESRFDPSVVSFAGAVGLMQLMPPTARGFGFERLEVPETNIHAGTRYMRHLYDLLDDVPDPTERYWFTLASYNAGFGHIEDARRLAEAEGLDPNVWFDNVADVAPLLQRRSVHRRYQYGYCRCNEPVAYVRKIRGRHRAYAEATRQ